MAPTISAITTFEGTPSALIDDDNALVPIDLAPMLPGHPEDRAWGMAYADMIAKARDHGWIDATTNAIRAHVEKFMTR